MSSFEKAWLERKPMKNRAAAPYFERLALPDGYREEAGKPFATALSELRLAAGELFGLNMVCENPEGRGSACAAEGKKCIRLKENPALLPESYRIQGSESEILLEACDEAGFLYGGFALLRLIRCGKAPETIDDAEAPANPLRMLNHWDNADGSIERGYSGRSFFFADGELLVGERTRMYARLVASAGINAVVINNVNVHREASWLITDRYFARLKELSDIFSAYHIRLFLSVNFSAPIEVGGLSTCDPLDESVKQWWKERCSDIYAHLPDFGGFLVKADSEGRPGPFTYGRNHAEGANMLAQALAPFGGTVIWRCFVYNCTQDWRDQKTDRARSAYDNFMPLDGQFAENVILQIKNGPMDFQVREPVLPLFGGLTKTRQMLEVQIAQEYTGHQIDLCYLIPWFKEILSFKTFCPGTGKDRVRDIISGEAFPGLPGGFAAVANTGDDENWTGHDLAAANLYGFGRLAFCPDLTAEEIAKEWISLTFGDDPQVMDVLLGLLLKSWPVYESYNAPLGIGWMCNPGIHYGPNVDGYEYDRWGTYHRSDCRGMGVDRTPAGTGYTDCYHSPLSEMYADPEKCPDELILFFHHLPYTFRLKSGKTIIQHIYDSHFEGAEQAGQMREAFRELEGKLPEKVFARTLERFDRQVKNAEEWRDRINTYYHRMSGIEEEKGRKIY